MKDWDTWTEPIPAWRLDDCVKSYYEAIKAKRERAIRRHEPGYEPRPDNAEEQRWYQEGTR